MRNLRYFQIITALGNFNILYNYQSIAVVILFRHWECLVSGAQCDPVWITSLYASNVFVGSILGQTVLGYYGDIFGADISSMVALVLCFVGIVGSCVGVILAGSAQYSVISVSRFIVGVGVGALYPLNAIKSAEGMVNFTSGNNLDSKVNARSIALSFFWKFPGSIFPWLVGYLLTLSPATTIQSQVYVLLAGLVPTIVGFIILWIERCKSVIPSEIEPIAALIHSFRIEPLVASLSINSTNASTNAFLLPFIRKVNRFNVIRELQRVHVLKTQQAVWLGLHNRAIVQRILVTGCTWFVFDMTFYGVTLFGDLELLSNTANVQNACIFQILSLGMGIPGVIITILLLDRFSVTYSQSMLFAVSGLSLVLLAVFLIFMQSKFIFYCLYLFLFFCLSGPNVTTFVLPTEMFTSPARITFSGIAAAIGKCGAALGTFTFGFAGTKYFPYVLLLCGFLSFLAAFITSKIIPLQREFRNAQIYKENY